MFLALLKGKNVFHKLVTKFDMYKIKCNIKYLPTSGFVYL